MQQAVAWVISIVQEDRDYTCRCTVKVTSAWNTAEEQDGGKTLFDLNTRGEVKLEKIVEQVRKEDPV